MSKKATKFPLFLHVASAFFLSPFLIIISAFVTNNIAQPLLNLSGQSVFTVGLCYVPLLAPKLAFVDGIIRGKCAINGGREG